MSTCPNTHIDKNAKAILDHGRQKSSRVVHCITLHHECCDKKVLVLSWRHGCGESELTLVDLHVASLELDLAWYREGFLGRREVHVLLNVLLVAVAEGSVGVWALVAA